jgi:hypothetical protein
VSLATCFLFAVSLSIESTQSHLLENTSYWIYLLVTVHSKADFILPNPDSFVWSRCGCGEESSPAAIGLGCAFDSVALVLERPFRYFERRNDCSFVYCEDESIGTARRGHMRSGHLRSGKTRSDTLFEMAMQCSRNRDRERYLAGTG